MTIELVLYVSNNDNLLKESYDYAFTVVTKDYFDRYIKDAKIPVTTITLTENDLPRSEILQKAVVELETYMEEEKIKFFQKMEVLEEKRRSYLAIPHLSEDSLPPVIPRVEEDDDIPF